MVTESPFPITASLAYFRNGYAKIRLTRQWEFLERKDVDTAITQFAFDHFVTDDDYELRIDGYWKTSANGTALRLLINDTLSTSLSNCHSQILSVRNGTGSAASGFVVAAQTSSNVHEHMIESRTLVATGDNRLHEAYDINTDGTTAASTDFRITGAKWEDTTTRITSIGLETTSIAGHIAVGSWFELYRKPQFNKTKIKLWVY